jgi:hypothetical protein
MKRAKAGWKVTLPEMAQILPALEVLELKSLYQCLERDDCAYSLFTCDTPELDDEPNCNKQQRRRIRESRLDERQLQQPPDPVHSTETDYRHSVRCKIW